MAEKLKSTRKARREKLGYELTQEMRAKRWKIEKGKMKAMVREK